MRALVSTRKGLLVLEQKGKDWKVRHNHFDGVKNSYSVYDPVHKCIWAGVAHGHWGPKIHISRDKGKSFQELGTPKFPEGHKDSLKDFWAVMSDSKGRVWLGVEPAGLFYSDDVGATWTFCKGFDSIRGKENWFGGGTDGSCLHSILIDPKNDSHVIAGVSVAGVMETWDRGQSWTYINKGLKAKFLPDEDAEIGQDPHSVVMAASDPQIVWQQNHCGIFKSENMGKNWQDLSKAKGVKSAFGWGIAIDEKDPKKVFTIPALSDETRVPINKRLIVQRTKNGGKSWEVITKGLPKGLCYDIVYRNAFSLKEKTLMFGSTTGNLYVSGNSGDSWKSVSVHLPPIYSVRLF
jgi:hypothetical protein